MTGSSKGIAAVAALLGVGVLGAVIAQNVKSRSQAAEAPAPVIADLAQATAPQVTVYSSPT